MDYSTALSAVIAERMEEAGIAQAAMAREATIPKATLQRRLSPYDALKATEFSRIAKVLGMRPSEISALAEARCDEYGPVQS